MMVGFRPRAGKNPAISEGTPADLSHDAFQWIIGPEAAVTFVGEGMVAGDLLEILRPGSP